MLKLSSFTGMQMRSAFHLVLTCSSFVLMSGLLRADDMAIVEQRIVTELSAVIPSDSEITESMNALGTNGLFDSISYTDPGQARTHLYAMGKMAMAYNNPDSSHYLSATLLEHYFRAFDGWVEEDPTDSNWWWREIGFPKALGEAMILMKSHFSPTRLSIGASQIARSYRPRSQFSVTNVGANRTDRSYATMLRALLTENTSLLRESFLSIGDVIEFTTGEGMQPDGSYHQHGPQLYIGGYGVVYVNGVSRYASYGAGTEYTFSARQIREFTDFMIDGIQWFLRGPLIDHSVLGRSITRTYSSAAHSSGFINSLESTIALAGSYRAEELTAMLARLEADRDGQTADPDSALVGNRSFWRSDYMAHHRPDFLATVKTASTRTVESEVINDEGKKSMHMSDGVLLIHRRGDEYTGIMPVWDWQRLPGTTIEQASYSLRPDGISSNWVIGTSTHAGGVSDGIDGAHAFIYEKRNVSAFKSWFFVGDAIVALGAAIDAPDATSPVLTTLNQAYLKSPVTYSSGDAPQTLTTDTATPAGLEWVHHDGTGYLFFGGQNAATIRAQSQSGALFDINGNQSTPEFTDLQTADVFSLELNHGTGFTGGSYAYVVAPGIEAGEMPDFPLDDLNVLSNSSEIQAVKSISKGLTLANFYAPGSVDGITVSHSCSVLVREQNGVLEVTVSDPSQEISEELTIQIDRTVAGAIEADGEVSVDQLSPGLTLRFNLVGSSGRSLGARLFTVSGSHTTLDFYPVADADVLDGTEEGNFGRETILRTKFDSSAGDWSESYLKFNLADLPDTLVSARLVMSPVSVTGDPALHSVAPVAYSSWSEDGITWNARPQTSGGPASLWMPHPLSPVHADVFPVLANAINGNGDLTLWMAPRLKADALVSFASRENPTSALRPRLELTFLSELAVNNSIGARTLTGEVELRGWLIADRADVSIYWGPVDGGTNPTSWANVIQLPDSTGGDIRSTLSDLPPGSTFHYRLYASNSSDSVWSSQSASFEVPEIAEIQLGNLTQVYDGTPRAVTTVTTPAGLTVNVTYNGGPDAPIEAGTYPIIATVVDSTYAGRATGTLEVAKATPVISNGPAASTLKEGQQLSDSVLSGGTATALGSSLAGSFQFALPATLPSAGIYMAEVHFIPSDTDNFATIEGLQVPVVVNANSAPVVVAGTDQFVAMDQWGPWSPAEIITRAWYDAADGNSLVASSGAVSMWRDKSGNNNHLIQSSNATKPKTGTHTLGGRNTVSFSASNGQYMDAANSDSLNFDSAGGMSTFIVFKSPGYNDQGGSLNAVFGKGSPFTGTAGYGGYGLRYDSNFTCSYKFADTDSLLLSPGSDAFDTPMLFSTIADHATGAQSFLINGGSLSDTRSADPPRTSDNPGVFRVGGITPNYSGGQVYRTTNRFADVDIGELILVPGALSPTGRQRIEGYLAHKWNLASSLPEEHPHKNEFAARAFGIANLQGSSTDAESHPLTHLWTVMDGPGEVSFGDVHALSTTAIFTTPGHYTLRLTSTDGAKSSFDEITILVGGSTAPQAFATWIGSNIAEATLAFTRDENADGVLDGLAWILGAPNPSTDVSTYWSSHAHSDGSLTFTFPLLEVEALEGVAVSLRYSHDLVNWTWVPVPATSGTAGDITFTLSLSAGIRDVEAAFPATLIGEPANFFFSLQAELPGGN